MPLAIARGVDDRAGRFGGFSSVWGSEESTHTSLPASPSPYWFRRVDRRSGTTFFVRLVEAVVTVAFLHAKSPRAAMPEMAVSNGPALLAHDAHPGSPLQSEPNSTAAYPWH